MLGDRKHQTFSLTCLKWSEWHMGRARGVPGLASLLLFLPSLMRVTVQGVGGFEVLMRMGEGHQIQPCISWKLLEVFLWPWSCCSNPEQQPWASLHHVASLENITRHSNLPSRYPPLPIPLINYKRCTTWLNICYQFVPLITDLYWQLFHIIILIHIPIFHL